MKLGSSRKSVDKCSVMELGCLKLPLIGDVINLEALLSLGAGIMVGKASRGLVGGS